MWKQLKVLSNYVIIHISDGCFERFFNLCRNNDISMWDVIYHENYIEAKILKKDFLKIKKHKKKSKVAIKIKKKVGVGFFVFKYRKHYSFLIGIFISVIMLKFLSMYIWNISYTGNTEYTDFMLDKFLFEKNYMVGMQSNKVDCERLEYEIRNSFENVTWVSVEIRGTRLVVHIKENDGVSQDINASQIVQNNAADICSRYDGTVVSIVTRRGTPLVTKGTSVQKGDVLVSSNVAFFNDNGENIYNESVVPDADITIMTNIDYYDCISRSQIKKIYTGKTIKKRIVGYAREDAELGINFRKFKKYDVVAQNKNISLVEDFYLPFWYGSKIYYEYEEKTVNLSDQEIQEELKENLKINIKKLRENNVQICNNRVNIRLNEDSAVMEGIIEAKVTEGRSDAGK